MGESTKWISPDERSRLARIEREELQRIKEQQREDAMHKHHVQLESLGKRHTDRYLPYRTTCPKDIRYDDLINHVDSAVLLQLLQKLNEDIEVITSALEARYGSLTITKRRNKY